MLQCDWCARCINNASESIKSSLEIKQLPCAGASIRWRMAASRMPGIGPRENRGKGQFGKVPSSIQSIHETHGWRWNHAENAWGGSGLARQRGCQSARKERLRASCSGTACSELEGGWRPLVREEPCPACRLVRQPGKSHRGYCYKGCRPLQPLRGFAARQERCASCVPARPRF